MMLLFACERFIDVQFAAYLQQTPSARLNRDAAYREYRRAFIEQLIEVAENNPHEATL